jgi:SagB-type dehydrogenase family enzyme
VKQFRDSRWSLRVNPSSGNLHPTEAYVVAGAVEGLAGTPAVYHYAPDRHAVDERLRVGAGSVECGDGRRRRRLLVALTSIHWREAWKYGERAFRYCQHDLGHAVAAVAIAAGLVGRQVRMLPDWSARDVARPDRHRSRRRLRRRRARGGGLRVARQSRITSRQS